MSDGAVRTALEQMEAWLADPAWDHDPDGLAEWNTGFLAALATADRGPGWEGLVARCHVLGHELELRTVPMEFERDRLKAELELQGRGNRALRGYGTGSR